MESSGKLSYTFRKYPLLRWILSFLIVAAVIFAIIFYNVKSKPVPVIDSINPPVGSPGDVVVLKGSNFGEVRDMNYVEIAGSKLTNSAYISWTDEEIKIVLPANVQDGLVYVGTKDRKSEPVLFANEVDIPVPVPAIKQVTRPIITSLSSNKIRIGEVLTIEGDNFGDSKNQSKVYFSADYGEKQTRSSNYLNNMISCNENDFDYVSWTNNEIKVHVPDGAVTGHIIVDTGKEHSEGAKITIDKSAGDKTYKNKKIYLLQYSADIADVVSSSTDTTITLRCPVPETTVYQPNVQINEVTPQPILLNYQKDLIHQITKVKDSKEKIVFNQSFVLPVYEVNTNVNPDKIGLYKDTEKNLLTNTVRADDLVPSNAEEVKKLLPEIIGRQKNPYRQAKLIYDYMIDNYEILSNPRSADSNPLDLINDKRGDAYDFAVIFTALLRACDIPSVTNAGVLVGGDLTTQSHWWSEFYIDRVGWIPVDVALGAGMEYNRWNDRSQDEQLLKDIKIVGSEDMSEKELLEKQTEELKKRQKQEDRQYYFGNMDSHHIVFSRGWNKLKPFSADNKIVQKPRSFALQSIWEEASANVDKYSSYWSVPVVKGIY